MRAVECRSILTNSRRARFCTAKAETSSDRLNIYFDFTLASYFRQSALATTRCSSEAPIALDLKLTNGDTVTIECGQENLPFLSTAINTAGVVAERARKAQPGIAISTEVPYRVKGVRAATSHDDKFVLAKFKTEVGTRVLVAMTPNLARETIARLTAELDQLGKRPPPIRL